MFLTDSEKNTGASSCPTATVLFPVGWVVPEPAQPIHLSGEGGVFNCYANHACVAPAAYYYCRSDEIRGMYERPRHARGQGSIDYSSGVGCNDIASLGPLSC